jgi:hypothetical protein
VQVRFAVLFWQIQKIDDVAVFENTQGVWCNCVTAGDTFTGFKNPSKQGSRKLPFQFALDHFSCMAILK